MKQIIIPSNIEEARAYREQLKTELKQIETQKEKVSRPLLDAIAAQRLQFAPAIKSYEEAIAKINSMLIEHQRAVLEQSRLQEQKILEDKRLKPSTIINKLSQVETVTSKGFRTQQIVKVTDITKIPLEYFDLSETRLLLDLKRGEKIPGAEIGEKLIPVS